MTTTISIRVYLTRANIKRRNSCLTTYLTVVNTVHDIYRFIYKVCYNIGATNKRVRFRARNARNYRDITGITSYLVGTRVNTVGQQSTFWEKKMSPKISDASIEENTY